MFKKASLLVSLSWSSGGRLQKFTRTPCYLEVVDPSDIFFSMMYIPSRSKIGSLVGKYRCISPVWSEGRSSELINSSCSTNWGSWCRLWLFSCVIHHCLVGADISSVSEEAVGLLNCSVTYGINLSVHT